LSWDRKSGVTDPYATNTTTPYQDVKLKVTSAPTLTLVSKAEAKNYLKLSSDTTDDDLVEDLVSASQGIIERELGGLALVTQGITQYQKGGIETIELMREPVIGTPTISYYSDFDTVTATNITATTYFRVVENELYHADGYWEEGRNGDGYTIQYDAGYFTASNYTNSSDPALNVFKTAILRTVAWLYEQREEHVERSSEGEWSVSYANELPMGIKRLVQPYHTGKGLI
jgi:hypothetical protein